MRVPKLLYHHSHALKDIKPVITGEDLTKVLPEPKCDHGCEWPLFSDEDNYHMALNYRPCYSWLQEQFDFWPVWLAVGNINNQWVISMTGYPNQFRDEEDDPEIVPRNDVLFSFSEIENYRYLSYNYWYIVLNSSMYKGYHDWKLNPINSLHRSWILKQKRKENVWIKDALDNQDVQAVVPELDLTSAKRIYCKDAYTQAELIDKGFEKQLIKIFKAKTTPL